MRHGNYGFRQENRKVVETLTYHSFVMKNKEAKVYESVNSLTDTGDFRTYGQGDLERIFSRSIYGVF